MRLLKNQDGITRTTLVIVVCFVVMFLFLFGLYFRSDSNVGVGEEYSDQNGPALLKSSEKLYEAIGNQGQFEAVTYDLAYFARSTLEKYKDKTKTKDVVFEIGNKLTNEGNAINFEGRFTESKDLILIKIEKKNFERIKTSITNDKSKKNIDAELPSNSKENQYIGTLPIKRDTYTITYFVATKSFFVSLKSIDIDTEQIAAMEEMKSSLGLEDLSTIELSFAGWSVDGNPISIPNPDKPEEDD
jgi:hypothetical protein